MPGVRAAALGRVTEGRVGKKLRSNKLQRIGEHLYRAQTGKVGRTLQRQGATPSASVRLVRPVSSIFWLCMSCKEGFLSANLYLLLPYCMCVNRRAFAS